MPQFDVTTFLPQIIWLVISYLVLYFLMAKVALPRIGGILEERQARIDDNLDAAQSLRNESNAEAEAYKESMAEAREQARSTIYDATQEMSADSARRHEELGERLSGELKSAEQRIAEAKAAAINSYIRLSQHKISIANKLKTVPKREIIPAKPYEFD